MVEWIGWNLNWCDLVEEGYKIVIEREGIHVVMVKHVVFNGWSVRWFLTLQNGWKRATADRNIWRKWWEQYRSRLQHFGKFLISKSKLIGRGGLKGFSLVECCSFANFTTRFSSIWHVTHCWNINKKV